MLSKEKVKCEKCGKKFRKVKVKKSKHSGKMLCTVCRKGEITNIFYIPQVKKGGRGRPISEYNISDEEKKVMREQLMKKGFTFKEANKKIVGKIRIMQSIKRNKQRRAIQFEYARRKQREQFLGGLGQNTNKKITR